MKIAKPIYKTLDKDRLRPVIDRDELPNAISFDVCTYCNHKCCFCSSTDKRTLKNKVSLKDFKIVMDNICSFVTLREIALFGKGEALLNRSLAEMITLCKQKYKIPYVFLTTNGSLLNKDKSHELFQNGLDSIKFSINASSESEYLKVHGSKDYKKVIRNLEDVIKLKRDVYPKIRIFISSIQKEKVSEDQLLNAFVRSDLQSHIDGVWVCKVTYTSSFEGRYSINKKGYSPCPLLWEKIYINSNCRLNICCRDYFGEYDMDDLRTQSLYQAYNSTNFIKLRKLHMNCTLGEQHICHRCLTFKADKM